MNVKCLLASVAVATTMLAGAANAAAALDLTSDGLTYPGTQYTLGFEFSVSKNSFIDALGVYDNLRDGLRNSAAVGLWDTSGNLLASVTVPNGTAGTLDGTFRFASITPYALTAGVHYIVGAYIVGDLASSFGTGQGGSATINPDVTIYGDRFSNFNSTFSFPSENQHSGSAAWVGGNFNLVQGGVPEPATWALMISGFALAGVSLRRRRVAA